jgi:hypothetical protein
MDFWMLFSGRRMMMKKVLITLLVLGLASVANAGLMFGVGGADAPAQITYGDVVQVIGVAPVPANAALYIAVYGDVTIAGGSVAYAGNLSSYQNLEEYAVAIGYPDGPALLADFEGFGLTGIKDLGAATLADGSANPAPLTGLLIDGIALTGINGGRLDLLDEGLAVIDSVEVIPEPMTIALLGLGGLFLRRRK